MPRVTQADVDAALSRVNSAQVSINKGLSEFIATILPNQVYVVQTKMALEALTRVVLKTPVDTGRARGGWQVTLDAAATGKTGKLDKGGTTTIQNGKSTIEGAQPYALIWIANNVQYIVYLEAGSSNQAPSGMVAITLEELLRMFP